MRQGYGVAALAVAVANTAVMFYLLKYLVDVAQLSPATAGLVIFLGEVWDALSNPIMGRLSDRTRAGMGRRRPWILFGSAPFMLSFAALFWGFPLHGWAAIGLYLLLLVAYNTTYTIVVVPYGALTPDLTEDYDERTRLIGVRMAWSMTGGILSGVAVPLVVQRLPGVLAGAGLVLPFGLQDQPWRLAMLLLAPMVLLPLLIMVAATAGRDRLPPERTAPSGGLWTVLRIPAFRRTAFLFLSAWSCIGVLAALVPFYVEHHLRHPLLLDAVFASIQLGALVCVPLAVKLAERVEKHRAYAACIATWALVLIGLSLVPEGTGTPALFVAALVGPGVAAAHVLPWSMLPDVVEVDAAQSGQDRAGAYYGLMTFLEKGVTGFALWCLGIVLELSGYVEGGAAAVQPESARLAIRVLIGPVPGLILLVAAAAALIWPPLTRAEHGGLVRRLHEGE